MTRWTDGLSQRIQTLGLELVQDHYFGIEDKRYTMHSSRAGWKGTDGTTMGVLIEYAGWKSEVVTRRCEGVTAYAAAAGVKRFSRPQNCDHRGGRPTAVRLVRTLICSVPARQAN